MGQPTAASTAPDSPVDTTLGAASGENTAPITPEHITPGRCDDDDSASAAVVDVATTGPGLKLQWVRRRASLEGCKLTLDSLDALDLEGARCTPRGDGGLRLRLRGGRRVLIRSPRKDAPTSEPTAEPTQELTDDAKLLDAVAGACAPPTVEDLVAACREAAPTGPAEPPQRLLLTDDDSDGDGPGADDAGADVCPVCLEALWRRPVAFFADAGRGRACPHFLHATCAAQIARHSDRCPTCRAPFARPRAMPPLDYADLAWVSTLCDGDGGVRRRDACAALAAQFPFDRAAVEVDLPWDAWGGDVLDAAKLCDVRTGLKAALLGPSSCSA